MIVFEMIVSKRMVLVIGRSLFGAMALKVITLACNKVVIIYNYYNALDASRKAFTASDKAFNACMRLTGM